MDNKDFEEVEDIFGENIEENYDVPVYEAQSNNVDNSLNVQEVPVVDTVNEDVPVYENVQSVEPNDSSAASVVDEETQTPIYENVIAKEPESIAEENVQNYSYDVQPEITSEPASENNVQTDYDVQPEVTPVEPEPVYEDVSLDNDVVNYGPVELEPTYNDEVNEHPDAIISLNNKEEEKSDVKLEDVPNIKLSDNKSLKFVIIIGIIVLVAIMLLPLLNKFSI